MQMTVAVTSRGDTHTHTHPEEQGLEVEGGSLGTEVVRNSCAREASSTLSFVHPVV